MVYLVTLVFIIITVIQVPGFIKQKLIKETVVYLILMCTALIYSYSELLNWNLPVQEDLLSLIFKPVSHFIFGQRLGYPFFL